MKCNNKYYEIVHGGTRREMLLHLAIFTAAIINNDEQEPKALASMNGLEVRELLGSETGNGKIVIDYDFEDGVLTIHKTNYDVDFATYTIRGCVGNAKVDATIVVYFDGYVSEFDMFDYVVKYVADGGGGDYKTDVYMDGDGRVMVERGDDGSTTIYDEHENPIIKRLADGTTEIFDAYQSPKIQLAANGACKIMSQGGGTAAIETKSNGDLVLKTYNGNEILLDNSGDFAISNADGYWTISGNRDATRVSFPDGDDCITLFENGECFISYHGDDRILLNQDGYVLYDRYGVEQVVSEDGSLNIFGGGNIGIIVDPDGNVNIRDVFDNTTVFIVDGDGVSIYSNTGSTGVTFDDALINKLKAL